MKENTTLMMQPRLSHVKELKAQHQSILRNKNHRGVRLAKNDLTLVRFSCSVWQKNCSFQFHFGFTKLTVVLFFFRFCFSHLSVNAIFHLHLCGMMQEMIYFRNELFN